MVELDSKRVADWRLWAACFLASSSLPQFFHPASRCQPTLDAGEINALEVEDNGVAEEVPNDLWILLPQSVEVAAWRKMLRSLKDYKIQEEYLQFIEEKLAKLGPLADVERTDKRRNEEENILILFRKLREGVSSSNRQDAFALQVYEMSLFLSAVFESSKQLNSVIPQLAPLYQSTSTHPQSCRLAATLVSLVHYLVDSYPLQGVYQQHLDSIPSSFLPASSEARKWMSALSRALRTHNYIGFEALSRSEAISSFCKDDGKIGVLAKPALLTTIEALRRKSRDTTWTILRSSYREWSCQPDYDITRDWLERCLALRSVLDTAKDVSVEEWLSCREKEGHVRRKDGVEGRWLVYRQK